MAGGGHHFVKMVTAVRPQQLMRSVIECLCMPNHFANLFEDVLAEPWDLSSNLNIRFD